MIDVREIRHFHLFCGLGGGARGFNRGEARVGNLVAKFRCIGGIDVDPAAVRDFGTMAGVPGTVLDLFDREQYAAFHGEEPPADWREATPADIQRAAGGERPHIVFLSAPCKGFSGLLSDSRSRSDKYQALNRLTLRGVWLMLEAFADDPPELIVFENVPRIASRGRSLLDRIEALLRNYGYATAETTHDCGELGGLGQSRKRFLLVARHAEKVPPFLYEPEKKPLRSVGDVIGRFPLPGALMAGPMHRIPSLQWKTWVRLAFVEAGSDWRSLNRLAIEDGRLRDYLIIPEMYNRTLGVLPWDCPSGTVTGNARPATGAFSVADPRCDDERGHYLGLCKWDRPSGAVSGRGCPTCGRFAVSDPRFPAGGEYGQIGVRKWEESTGTVIGVKSPIQGGFSVADPRMPADGSGFRKQNIYRVVKYDEKSGTVMGVSHTAGGAMSVADPCGNGFMGKYRVTRYDSPANTVIAGSTTGMGAFSVADPRPVIKREPGEDWQDGGLWGVVPFDSPSGAVKGAACHDNGRWSVADPRFVNWHADSRKKFAVTPWEYHAGCVIGAQQVASGALAVADPRCMDRVPGDHYLTGGHYGVVPWEEPCGAVSAAACHDNGRWSVADPRIDLPSADERLIARIIAEDGTWHRPFTTLELAALQGLVEPEEHLELDGLSDSAWRERIGNAVPPPAAQAIAGVMGQTLLLAWSGETFMLGSTPIWVHPIEIALSVAQPSYI